MRVTNQYGTITEYGYGNGWVTSLMFMEKFLLPETVNIMQEEGKPDKVLTDEESLAFYNKYAKYMAEGDTW